MQRAISIIEDIKSHVPTVGETMMDGGSQNKFLYQLVGKKRYHKYFRYFNCLKILCFNLHHSFCFYNNQDDFFTSQYSSTFLYNDNKLNRL